MITSLIWLIVCFTYWFFFPTFLYCKEREREEEEEERERESGEFFLLSFLNSLLRRKFFFVFALLNYKMS